jgi:hypothetical protein
MVEALSYCLLLYDASKECQRVVIIMFRLQIKKIARSLLMQSSQDYCDERGVPSRLFLESVARSIGGVPGFMSMPSGQLPVAILRRLGCDSGRKDFASSDWPDWFNSVTSATANFFAKGQHVDKRQFLTPILDIGGLEGGRQMATHQKVERNAKIVKFLKENTTDKDYLGFVFCRVCRVAPGARFGVEVIEAHHVLPIAQAGVKKPKLSDFILVCPTCHAALHKGAKIDLPPI